MNILIPARDGVKPATDVWFPVGVEGNLLVSTLER